MPSSSCTPKGNSNITSTQALAECAELFLLPIHYVKTGAGVMRELFLLVNVLAQLFLRQADGFVPSQAFLDPALVPIGVGAGVDEELQFHLLKLAAAERKVTRIDLITERLADLRDTERFAGRGMTE